MVRSTDFNIREALKRNRQLLTGAQESGRAALAGYEELAPQYNRAVEQARNYQGTLTRDYKRYVQDRNQAVDTYNQQLEQRYQTYQSVTAQGAGLERSYKAAQQELNRLGGIKEAAATEANRRYRVYSDNYQTSVRIGQQQYESQIGSYRTQIGKLEKEAQGYSANITALTKDIEQQQRNISGQENFRSIFQNNPAIAGRFVIDSTNKMYRVFTDDQNRYQKAQEYDVIDSGYYRGYTRQLGMVTDSGYGSLTNAIKFLSKRGTMTLADAVYERYRRGASTYDTYKATADRTQTYIGYIKQANQRISDYQKQISNFQTGIRNNEQRITGLTTQISGVNTNLENLVKDTGYVTRYAQQQTGTVLSNYQDYLKNTYNPSVASYNQYASGTYSPAAQAYQSFMGSGQVQQALQSYQSLAQDTGFVDRAASDTKAVYDASQQEYSRLQAAYEGMAPQLSEYTRQAESAKQQVLTLSGQAPGLQRSLAIDTEARKRGDRLGYRRSVLSQGFKRRGAAR